MRVNFSIRTNVLVNVVLSFFLFLHIFLFAAAMNRSIREIRELHKTYSEKVRVLGNVRSAIVLRNEVAHGATEASPNVYLPTYFEMLENAVHIEDLDILDENSSVEAKTFYEKALRDRSSSLSFELHAMKLLASCFPEIPVTSTEVRNYVLPESEENLPVSEKRRIARLMLISKDYNQAYSAYAMDLNMLQSEMSQYVSEFTNEEGKVMWGYQIKLEFLLVVFVFFLIMSSIYRYVAVNRPLRNYRKAVEEGEDVVPEGCTETGLLGVAINNYKQAAIDLEMIASRHELKLAEEKEKARSDFLSSISHDMRTPMNAIIGLSTIARNELRENSGNPETIVEVSECLDKIVASSGILMNLISDVLDMSRIERNSFDLKPVSFSLNELTENVNAVIEQQTLKKNIDFSINIEKKLDAKAYIGDVQRLKQMLVNVLGNSVKFTKEGGQIECDIQEVPSDKEGFVDLKITCSDNGCGMSKDYIPHIFEVFSQESRTKAMNYSGTGLGMSITKKIIDSMGGNICVESEVDQGTIIKMEVPLQVIR